MVDFFSLPCQRLLEDISVPLNFWHHALRLPLVRRVGGPRGQPVSMLCGMDRVMLYNMNVWSRQDRVLKLDRAMLYNMNGQSRQDSVVTTLLAMPTSIV